ncbi:cation diffusion facilitator family transporter [Streptomyces sp. NBC_01724]|uniref:cation diffusion facilitator family transporter n=1 Tax=Streptomyces TaxID=1883 RepID=UPI0028C4D05D|nr:MULTISPECIES: cation diffusion facilitator family transporter [unclassified Streptomyces]WNO68314.1 cation diffusion facilitator family transporter [Streptomyces sp. AM2-3-1]WSC72972.1 cation diffusion facilitator family transporter [Streptomyces sp. NBC_01760]WTE63414.1 cation diffusion facilitator family transporter [Streptomyces sp. NBC_01617]WTI90701.1 cation diffusion facilitator family transporter [Streptomyces sp. NBC_00724]
MGAGHDHGHTHGGPPPTGTAAAAYKGRLRVALCITLTVMVLEIVGGLLSDSLALIADAAHMATDALGLGMALLAIHVANKPAGLHLTFGYARAEILAALANCLLLLGVGGYLLFEAVERFITPTETRGGLTIVFALLGLVANMISLSLLMRGQKESLNVRGAYLEVLADTLGSVTVLVSASIILTTGWQAADPIASLLIGLMIVPRTVKLLRETLDVLLESAPKGVDMGEVRAHITALPGVLDVHDLHAWTITSGMPVLSAHVVVHQELLDSVGHEKLLHELQGCLGVHFDVEHCTFQLEPIGHAEHEAKLCH